MSDAANARAPVRLRASLTPAPATRVQVLLVALSGRDELVKQYNDAITVRIQQRSRAANCRALCCDLTRAIALQSWTATPSPAAEFSGSGPWLYTTQQGRNAPYRTTNVSFTNAGNTPPVAAADDIHTYSLHARFETVVSLFNPQGWPSPPEVYMPLELLTNISGKPTEVPGSEDTVKVAYIESRRYHCPSGANARGGQSAITTNCPANCALTEQAIGRSAAASPHSVRIA